MTPASIRVKVFSKSRAFVAVVAIAFIAGWVCFTRNRGRVVNESASKPLAQMLGPGALHGFTLAATDARRDSTVFTLTNRDFVLKIEVLEHIEAGDAETLLRDGIMGLQALYANALSPYPGDITKQVTTDPAFQPRLFQATDAPLTSTYFLLYANERFSYGAMTRDSVKFKSLAGWCYCPARKAFLKVKVFAPLSAKEQELAATFAALRCE